MTNVVPLNGRVISTQAGEPRQEVIDILENMLERAKSGQLQSFVATGFVAGGDRLAVWAGHHDNIYEMLGSIHWLGQEYVDRMTGKVE